MRTQCEAEAEADIAMKGSNIVARNSLADLAARVHQAHIRAKAATVEAAEPYLEAGRLLIEAKGECKHGEWRQFLEAAGVHERQAQRLLQMARSGLNSDIMSGLGGLGATLAYLAERKLPATGQTLFVDSKDDGPIAAIWESEEHPGYYHVATVDADRGEVTMTRRPLTGQFFQNPDGIRSCPVWETLELFLNDCAGLRFTKFTRQAARDAISVFRDLFAHGHTRREVGIASLKGGRQYADDIPMTWGGDRSSA